MRRFAGGGVAFLVIFLTGTGARAETIDGRVRLGFEGGIIEHQNVTATFTGANFGGASVESDQTRTAVGLGSIPFGPVLGYGLSEHVLLSGHFDVVNRNRSADGQDGTDAFGADLYATLSYVAGHGAVLPFAGPLIGFQTVSGDGDSSSYSEQTYTFGVQAGAHAFATPSFSVDPSLMLGYMTGSGEAGASAVDFSGLVVGIRVALSGWLGGKSEEPRADDEPPEYYPPAYVPGAVPPSYPANPQPDPAYPPQPQQPGYPQQQPAYPQQQPGYPQQQPGYPPQQPGYQAPPSSPPPTSSSPSPALPPSAPAP